LLANQPGKTFDEEWESNNYPVELASDNLLDADAQAAKLETLVADAVRKKKAADAEKAWSAVAEKEKVLFAGILRIIGDHADSGPITDAGITSKLKKSGTSSWHRSTINKRIIKLQTVGLATRVPGGGLKLTDLGIYLVSSWHSASF
jgi:hypothetical protein